MGKDGHEKRQNGARYNGPRGWGRVGGTGRGKGGVKYSGKGESMRMKHRVYRMPGFPSSRPNRVSTIPSPASDCCSHPPGSKGADTLACERGGGGGPNSDEGTDTLLQFMLLYYSSKGMGGLYIRYRDGNCRGRRKAQEFGGGGIGRSQRGTARRGGGERGAMSAPLTIKWQVLDCYCSPVHPPSLDAWNMERKKNFSRE
jgi:hypothetical protein